MSLTRDHRLTEGIHRKFQVSGLFPTHRALIKYFQKHKAAGRGNVIPTHIKSRVFVTLSIAEAFVEFVLFNPDTVPEEIYRLAEENKDDPNLVYFFFEKADTYSRPSPQETNDPSMGGIRALASATYDAISSLGWLNPKVDTHQAYVNSDEEYEQLDNESHAFIGYSLAKKDQRLTHCQAIRMGRDYFGGPDGRMAGFLKTLGHINNDCVRYAVDKGGNRVGFSCAYAITDDAYVETVKGNRNTFEHTPDEIVPRGNSIVLTACTEFHNTKDRMRKFKQRLVVQSSMLTQIALLLDPFDRRPFRAITYTIAPDNNKRLAKLGFAEVKNQQGDVTKHSSENKCEYSVVEFDPTKQPNFVKRHVMLMLTDNIWRIRNSIEEMEA